MNDKELLELAARAADEIFTVKLSEPCQGNRKGPFIIRRQRWVQWNPLTDDGDALRLAVKLGIRILHTCIESTTGDPNAVRAGTFIHGEAEEMYEDHDGDAMAATRRAITRAAAEIGRKI